MVNALVAGTLALALAVAAQSVVTVSPLFDRADPVRLWQATLNLDDPDEPEISVQLENTTARPIPLDEIWLRASQFFTPSEVARMGSDVADACGRLGRAEFERPATVLPPGGRAVARFSMGPGCNLDAPHLHVFIHVASIGPGPIDAAIWNRDPSSFGRLLAAAMPHP